MATLTAALLVRKGTVCHLCGYPGATSADHDPPRSVLLELGVANPDHVDRYLWPSHLVCNQRRRTRRLTDQLKSELRRRYEADNPPPATTTSPTAARSSRWTSSVL